MASGPFYKQQQGPGTKIPPTNGRACVKTLKDANGFSGGVSRWLLRKRSEDIFLDATGLARGGARLLLTA